VERRAVADLRLDGDQWHDGRLVGLSIAMSRRGTKAAVEATLPG
jgi:hypothetical protein